MRYRSCHYSDPAKRTEQVELAMEQLTKRAAREKRGVEYRRNHPSAGGVLYAGMYQAFHGIHGQAAQAVTITHEEAVELARLSDALNGSAL